MDAVFSAVSGLELSLQKEHHKCKFLNLEYNPQLHIQSTRQLMLILHASKCQTNEKRIGIGSFARSVLGARLFLVVLCLCDLSFDPKRMNKVLKILKSITQTQSVKLK